MWTETRRVEACPPSCRCRTLHSRRGKVACGHGASGLPQDPGRLHGLTSHGRGQAPGMAGAAQSRSEARGRMGHNAARPPRHDKGPQPDSPSSSSARRRAKGCASPPARGHRRDLLLGASLPALGEAEQRSRSEAVLTPASVPLVPHAASQGAAKISTAERGSSTECPRAKRLRALSMGRSAG